MISKRRIDKRLESILDGVYADPTRRSLLCRALALGLGANFVMPGTARAQSGDFIEHPRGGYRFIPGSPVFATGARANSDHEMVHVLLRRALPLADGYAAIETYLKRVGRPPQALSAMELRAPKQMTLDEFGAFNKGYIEQLRRWEVFVEGHNPISRVNVAPSIEAPSNAALHGFCYCAGQAAQRSPSFVISGIADVGPQGVVARGDTSAAGMRARLAYLIARVDERLTQLGVTWSDVTQTDLYAAHDVQALARTLLLPRLGEAARSGVRWYAARPPVIDTELELDVRGVYREIVLEV